MSFTHWIPTMIEQEGTLPNMLLPVTLFVSATK